MFDCDFIKIHSDGTISLKNKERNVFIVNINSIRLNFTNKDISKIEIPSDKINYLIFYYDNKVRIENTQNLENILLDTLGSKISILETLPNVFNPN